MHMVEPMELVENMRVEGPASADVERIFFNHATGAYQPKCKEGVKPGDLFFIKISDEVMRVYYVRDEPFPGPRSMASPPPTIHKAA